MRSFFISLLLIVPTYAFSQEQTYAEKLGFPKGAKVLILHVDDVGMSWDSNQGAIHAMEKGVANSVSIMMPCPWVPGFIHYLKDHPNIDAGLHLTLTAEWKDYRWHGLSGKSVTPGLVDSEGALWSSVPEVVAHATADEVEAEIKAQLDRARTMGLNPTHLDSHMGTLFATPEFLQRYIKVGIENKIPVMFPGGHVSMIAAQSGFPPQQVEQLRETGKMLWNAGLPVLDDLHNLSYGFNYPDKTTLSDAEHQNFSTSQYMETITRLKPGLTMVIMHCSAPSEIFKFITDSGKIRKGDLLAMSDPEFKKFLEREKIILTTWREVMERRSRVK
jgi:chitin disaccharide deacetylase